MTVEKDLLSAETDALQALGTIGLALSALATDQRHASSFHRDSAKLHYDNAVRILGQAKVALGLDEEARSRPKAGAVTSLQVKALSVHRLLLSVKSVLTPLDNLIDRP